MPKFSRFQRFGHVRFSSKPPHGELIYRDRIANYGDGINFDDSDGTAFGAEQYMEAMALARAKYTLERAGNQHLPLKAREMLPKLEWELGVIPSPTATIRERQIAVSAAAKVARGASKENVERVLTELLGDDFLAIIPTDKADAETAPSTPDEAGIWEKPGSPKSTWRLTSSVTHTGIPETCTIEFLAGDEDGLRVGRRIALDMGNDTRAEAVVLTAVTDGSITATFTRPHNTGTVFCAGRVPNQSTTKRFNLVVLSATAMTDPEKRRKANRALRQLLRGVSTWSLVAPSGVGTAGPFMIGSSEIGIESIDSWSY